MEPNLERFLLMALKWHFFGTKVTFDWQYQTERRQVSLTGIKCLRFIHFSEQLVWFMAQVLPWACALVCSDVGEGAQGTTGC